ncbi:MAG: branched-chain amino acid transporter permease [Ilumatobacteraceae bacterium]|nr:branched-chain amino acid transporter permease [Ilumatobacteraceae bacterium]
MIFLQQLYNALAVAAIYVAVALGITLIYGLTRIVNFAHGQLLTLGSFITYELVQRDVPFVFAIIGSMIVVSIAGEVLDLLLFRRTLANPLNGFVISLGLIVVVQSVVVLIWGPDQRKVAPPFGGVWVAGGVRFDQPRLLMLACTIAVVVLLFIFLKRSKAGRGIRALAEDPTAARLVGVPVSPYISLTFVLGSGIAAMAGGLLAATFPFDAYSGFDFVLKGFAVAIIGGLGSVIGAVIAGLLLALAETIGAAYFSIQWAPAFGLAATALIILIRPSGLFRGAGSVGQGHFGSGAHEATVHARESVIRIRRRAAGKMNTQRAVATAVWAVAIVILITAPTLLSTARSLSVATNMILLAIAAFAFWFPFRYAGIFSMASGAMMGVGAYTAAISLTRWDMNFWLQLPLAFGVAALVALVMGLIALRTSTSYFVILTLVLSQLVVLVFASWKSVTRGAFGIVTTSPPDPVGPFRFDTPAGFYRLCLGALAVTVIVLFAVSRSAFGRRLASVRENEPLARSLGINAFRDKVIAFMLFGGFSGVAGVLLFHYLRFIQPDTFSVYSAINVQLIVLLGGIGIWIGPIVGAATFAFLPEIVHLDPVQSSLAYGLVLIAVILFLPMGLGGTVRRWFVWWQWRHLEPVDTAEPPVAVAPSGSPLTVGDRG